MATATYEPINTATLTAGQTTVTFTAIPQTYTDLILVANWTATTNGAGCQIQMGNSSLDTGANYNQNAALGGSSLFRQVCETAGQNAIYVGELQGSGANPGNTFIARFVNYANTSYRKPVYLRWNFHRPDVTNYETAEGFGIWRSTSAIERIQFARTSLSLASGTLTLYGIKAS